MHAIDPPASGGGSSSGSGTASAGPTTSSLASDAKNNLDAAKVQIDQFCMAHNILGAVWNSNLTIATNVNLDKLGQYNPKTGTMEFRDAGAISDKTLLHELTHVYQNFLSGPSVNTKNMEFEAWLMEDLYLVSAGKDKYHLAWTNGIDSEKLKSDYYNWVKSILYNGFTSDNSSMCTFWKTLCIQATGYDYLPLGTGSFPSIVDKLLNQCKN